MSEFWHKLGCCVVEKPQPKKRRRRIDRTMIGEPMNFVHLTHIGSGEMGAGDGLAMKKCHPQIPSPTSDPRAPLLLLFLTSASKGVGAGLPHSLWPLPLLEMGQGSRTDQVTTVGQRGSAEALGTLDLSWGFFGNLKWVPCS
ncbi:CDC42 small effector protein 1 [Sigmodon hispidus]